MFLPALFPVYFSAFLPPHCLYLLLSFGSQTLPHHCISHINTWLNVDHVRAQDLSHDCTLRNQFRINPQEDGFESLTHPVSFSNLSLRLLSRTVWVRPTVLGASTPHNQPFSVTNASLSSLQGLVYLLKTANSNKQSCVTSTARPWRSPLVLPTTSKLAKPPSSHSK